jgi:hypothetical protein
MFGRFGRRVGSGARRSSSDTTTAGGCGVAFAARWAWAVVPEGRRYVSERVEGAVEGEEAREDPWGDDGEGSLLYGSDD